MVVLGSGLALALNGCGAGQITQTGSQAPAVNGAQAEVGTIALRNIELVYPAESDGVYQRGDDAPVLLTIANTGGTDDALVSISSPLAGEVPIAGDKTVPAGDALAAEDPEGASEGEGHAAPGGSDHSSGAGLPSGEAQHGEGAQPSGQAEPGAESGAAEAPPQGRQSAEAAEPGIGTLHIVLQGLKNRVYPGQTVPMTFVFRNAGEVSVDVPIGAAAAEPESHGGHGSGH